MGVSVTALNQQLCDFLDASPTPFHAVRQMVFELERAGFEELDEGNTWDTRAGGNYYVIRNGSSIVAWRQGGESPVETGLRLVGAHTDSPCLKVKPQPDVVRHDCWQLGVEVYGGALLNPWFDRDLSLAGRVHYCDQNNRVGSALIDFQCPVAIIPSLAIHLDREANSKRSINAQLHLPVLMAVSGRDQGSFDKLSLESILLPQVKAVDDKAARILDHELCFYDTQKASTIGYQGDFIASARLDNLLSCFLGLQALLAAEDGGWSMLVCNDHEEVGSNSAVGAAGPFLQQVLRRLVSEQEDYARCIDRSLMLSVDNAHGLHPNFSDKMDTNHGPRLNAGPVMKINASQRYASNSETQARFRALCEQLDVPVQSFVVRSDMACGSTIGPITATELGIKTLDIGVPTYGMHSIRELSGSQDTALMATALEAFYRRQGE